MNVLLADDEKSIAITLRDALADAGHKVTVVGDGREALAELQANRLLLTTSACRGWTGSACSRRRRPSIPPRR
jgi:DNA-binding response OmpR family regulator